MKTGLQTQSQTGWVLPQGSGEQAGPAWAAPAAQGTGWESSGGAWLSGGEKGCDPVPGLLFISWVVTVGALVKELPPPVCPTQSLLY